MSVVQTKINHWYILNMYFHFHFTTIWNFFLDTSLFVGPLASLVWTSGDVYPEFQRQGKSYTCVRITSCLLQGMRGAQGQWKRIYSHQVIFMSCPQEPCHFSSLTVVTAQRHTLLPCTLQTLSEINLLITVDTGWTRLIRNDSAATFSLELSGNLN